MYSSIYSVHGGFNLPMNLVMQIIIIYLFITSVLLTGSSYTADAKRGDQYAYSLMQGISNKGKTMNKPFIAAGDRTYIIGTQDGMFPDMGGHVRGEMAGLWLHPIKLMDGYWCKVKDIAVNKEEWLISADDFINYPYGNKQLYNHVLNDLSIERFQFSPDGEQGMIVKYTIKNNSNKARPIQFTFACKTELSPVWLSDKLNIHDDDDVVHWDSKKQEMQGFDKSNNWFLSVSSTAHHITGLDQDVELPQQTIGKGKAFATVCKMVIPANGTKIIEFIIAGSYKNKEEASRVNARMKAQTASLLDKKITYYTTLINKAKIIIPDKRLQEVYNWIKINTHWLIRDVPESGRGLGAGFMEYPWWFGCDNTYALQGALASGDLSLGLSTLRLIQKISETNNGNGQIIHEASSNGVVYNPGNTQETAHFIMAVWKAYEWTGDNQFLAEMYPSVKKGINWLMTDMDKNGNLFPEGYGIMEVPGLNTEVIDVIVYAQQALECVIKMATKYKEFTLAKEYTQMAVGLKNKIDKELWNEKESLYYDFYGSKSQAIAVLDSLINFKNQRSGNAEIVAWYQQLKEDFSNLEEKNIGWFTQKNWVIATPMETGMAPKDKAVRSLDVIREKHCGKWGPYLAATEKSGAMTISTGVQAVAEAKYGRIDEALWYIHKIVETFNLVLPGSISEGMPDRGCFTQAWTNYGVIVPVICHVFGVQPKAYEKSIDIVPDIPKGWKEFSLEELKIGDTELSMKRSETGDDVYYEFKSLKPDWTLHLKLPHQPAATYTVNNVKILPVLENSRDCFTINGSSNIVKISYTRF